MRHTLPASKFDRLVDEALFEPKTANPYTKVFKRVFDVVCVVLAAPAVLLIVLALCVLIARDGNNPFYFQKRVGRHGKVFYMWKLRSMVVNADERLKEHLAENPAARAEWDRDQKLRHDPRVTKIGRLIRKTSLDELPQLFNVLRGDMSLVGPRPMMECQKAMYPGSAYYAMRPGVTGFWQISARNDSSFVERADFDADYLREMSFATDLTVLLNTVRVVVKGTGC